MSTARVLPKASVNNVEHVREGRGLWDNMETVNPSRGPMLAVHLRPLFMCECQFLCKPQGHEVPCLLCFALKKIIGIGGEETGNLKQFAEKPELRLLLPL